MVRLCDIAVAPDVVAMTVYASVVAVPITCGVVLNRQEVPVHPVVVKVIVVVVGAAPVVVYIVVNFGDDEYAEVAKTD